MTNRANLKEFAAFTSLNMLGMIGLSCYILADTFFVARGLGTDGLAALNLAIPVFSLIQGGGLMLGMGGATQYTILKSQNDSIKANRAFNHAIFMGALLAVVLAATGLFLSGTIAAALGAARDVFDMCNTYLRVLLIFAPLFIINNIVLCFVRNDGAPQLAMLAMVAGSFSNIALDYLFIFPLRMGIFGAVLATGCAPIISLLVLSVFFAQKRNDFHLEKIHVNARVAVNIISCGVSYLIAELASGVVMIAFNFITMGIAGYVGVAAYGVIANIAIVVLSIFTGVAQGIQPIISRQFGMRDRLALASTLRYALVLIAVLSAVVYALVFFCAGPIASAFNGAQNPQMQCMATTGLKIYFIFCAFAGFNIIVSGYFSATSHARPAYVISLLRGFIIVLPVVYGLSAIWGMAGVWCALPVAEALVSLVTVGLYFKCPI